MDYVVGNSHTFQSRHWLDKDSSITVIVDPRPGRAVVSTDYYLILNDGRQSAVIALDEKLRQRIAWALNIPLIPNEGRVIDDLHVMCTDRNESHRMEWRELSVGGVTVYLEERDIPTLAKLLGGT